MDHSNWNDLFLHQGLNYTYNMILTGAYIVKMMFTKSLCHALKFYSFIHLEHSFHIPLLFCLSNSYMVLGQNGRGQNGMDKMVLDKMVRTKWYG